MVKTFIVVAITILATTLIGIEQIYLSVNLHYLVLIVLSILIWYFSQSKIIMHMEENSVVLPYIIASFVTIAIVSFFEWCVQTWYTIGKESTITQVDLRFIFLITFVVPPALGVYMLPQGADKKEFWPGIIFWLFGSLWMSR